MSETILTVEKRDDGQYYVLWAGQEFILASPINIAYETQPEWRYVLNKFRFSAVRLEEVGRG